MEPITGLPVIDWRVSSFGKFGCAARARSSSFKTPALGSFRMRGETFATDDWHFVGIVTTVLPATNSLKMAESGQLNILDWPLTHSEINRRHPKPEISAHNEDRHFWQLPNRIV